MSSKDPIRKITLASGRVRYRFVVDTGRDPATGRRVQITRTFDTMRDARAERARIISETAQGTFVRPRRVTVAEYIDQWLPGATRNARPSTVRNYTDAMAPVKARLGEAKLQDLTKADVEHLVDWMVSSGRKRGGKAGTGLGPRSIRLTLGRLTAMLETALNEGLVVRNVARLVSPPSYEPTEREAWTPDQVRAFRQATAATRLSAVWMLAFLGLRRGELLGLRWDDLKITDGEVRVSIVRARTLVAGQVQEGKPKTKGSERTLPVPDLELVAALRKLRTIQAAERLAAGEVYETTGYVVVDELGSPVHPEWASDEFERERRRADLPRIVLHGTRHTSATVLDEEGIPEADNSMWHGHSTSGRVSTTRKHYIHPDVERRLRAAGAVLAGAFRTGAAVPVEQTSQALIRSV